MNSIIRYAFLAAITTTFFACGGSKQVAQIEHRVLDTIEVTARKEKPPYQPTATKTWDIAHTRVALNFNWQKKTADGKAWIKLHPYFYATDTLALDAKSMKIEKVMMSNSPVPFEYNGEQLKLNFNKKYNRQDTINLYIEYTAMPYAGTTGGSKAISDDRGLYFINTDKSVPYKPAQIWTQGETEANSHWLPTIDKPNERFTMQMELTVPDTMQTLATGRLSKQIPKGNMRTDIWVMDKPIQTYAYMMAIGRFAIVKDKWKGKEVNYYVEPPYEQYARRMFNHTPEMMTFFSEVTGVPYPWNKYSQIVVRDYVSGAMENTTASLYGEFMYQNFREMEDKDYEDIVSHELFHQWFGDYVTQESWTNLTVSESFANYSEQLWRNYKYGKASADILAWEDLAKYIYQSTYNDAPLVRHHYFSREEMFDRISYQKGGAILRYMHSLMGDSAFYKAMNIYLTENALQSAEATHWRLAVEEATGQDWRWFFDQWYNRGGHPKLDVTYEYDDEDRKLLVTVVQTQAEKGEVYKLPLKALLINGDSKEVVDWNIDEEKEVFIYNYKGNERPALVPDDERMLIGVIKEDKSPKQWLAQYRYSDNVISRLLAVEAARKKVSNDVSKQVLREAMNDEHEYVRQAAIKQFYTLKRGEYYTEWNEILKEKAANDEANKVRAAALYVLGNWNDSSSKQLFINALSDSSYAVAGAGLYGINHVDSAMAYDEAKRIIINNDPKADLRSMAWSIIQEAGRGEDAALFQEHAHEFYGTSKLGFAGSLMQYAQNTDNAVAFETALDIIADFIRNENIKPYRSVMVNYLLETAKYYDQLTENVKEEDVAAMANDRLDMIREKAEPLAEIENEEEILKMYRQIEEI